jgi:predicted amidohydrolase YtcJ
LFRPAITLVVALACTSVCPAAARDVADLVFRRARVMTLAPNSNPACSAIAIRADRIVYAGDERGVEAWIAASTRVIDAAGMTITPGLVDAHGHLHSLGRRLEEPDLTGTDSKDACVRRVRDYQARIPAGEWIHGRGWDQNDWANKEFPTWKDLDAFDQNPVYLERVDGHALWVNRRAMDLAGITRDTPDPPGGKIIRDKSGEPTGILVDNAEALIEDHVADPSAEMLDRRFAAAIAECNRVGLTGVHDAGTTRTMLASLRRLGARDLITLNIHCMVDSDDGGFARERLAAGPAEEFGGRIVLRSLKLRADGAMGSRGAAMLAPYDDDPHNVGLNVQTPDTILAWTRLALEHGFQACTHAIGDRGNRLVLDAYEQALRERPNANARLRIEHCQILDPADLARFAALGVIASMQPTHATSDMPWAEARVGKARLQGAYAWRQLLKSRSVLAFGSDFPVESVDPLLGLYAATTRQDEKGNPRGGWRPEEKLTLEEAVHAFTVAAAYAGFDEAEAGYIAPGMRADLTVIDRDIVDATPRELLDARAKYTVVRGRVVYEAR